jgi:hypothetical protein
MPYPDALDQLVLDCMNSGMPAKVFVAIPAEAKDVQYRENVRRANSRGVGLIEIGSRKGRIIHNALSLSLTAYRPLDKQQYPAKYRRALSDAERTFREGNPGKGCAILYDELEALTRRRAKRAVSRGCWSGNPPKINFERDAWQNVVETLRKNFDLKKCGRRNLDQPLWGRVLRVVPFRNQVGHKPTRLKELIARDARLRTRFEDAGDLLLELILASGPLRV